MSLTQIDPLLENQIRTRFEAGLPIDEILVFMLDQGLFAIPSIKMVRKYRNVSLGEAQDIVCNSPVWYGASRVADQRPERNLNRAETNRDALLLEDARKTVSEAQRFEAHNVEKAELQTETLATQ